MGKTHSKPLAARHDRGTAWARHAMCESAFTLLEAHASFQLQLVLATLTRLFNLFSVELEQVYCHTLTNFQYFPSLYLPTSYARTLEGALPTAGFKYFKLVTGIKLN